MWTLPAQRIPTLCTATCLSHFCYCPHACRSAYSMHRYLAPRMGPAPVLVITWIKQQHCACNQGGCTSSQLVLHALLHGQTLCEEHEFKSTSPCMGCEPSAKTGRATCQVLPSGIAIRMLLECARQKVKLAQRICQISANSMGVHWGYDMSHLYPLPKHGELKQT